MPAPRQKAPAKDPAPVESVAVSSPAARAVNRTITATEYGVVRTDPSKTDLYKPRNRSYKTSY